MPCCSENAWAGSQPRGARRRTFGPSSNPTRATLTPAEPPRQRSWTIGDDAVDAHVGEVAPRRGRVRGPGHDRGPGVVQGADDLLLGGDRLPVRVVALDAERADDLDRVVVE